MGYKPVSNTYNLTFEAYPGLQLKVRSLSIGELARSYNFNMNLNVPDPAKQTEIFDFFSSKIVSWNMEHPEVENDSKICTVCELTEGAELPPTTAGMLCLELNMVMTIIFNWINTVAKVANPKGSNSSNGGVTIPEDIMKQLEALQSPMKLPTPNLS